MSNVFYPRMKRKLKNDSFIRHKIRPSFCIPKKKEYHPNGPCNTCFTSVDYSDCVYEELGIRDLLNSEACKQLAPSALCVLEEHFETIQVHWGQIEKLQQLEVPKLFVANYQNIWDLPILAYSFLCTTQKHTIKLLNNYDMKISPYLSKVISCGGDNTFLDELFLLDLPDSDIQFQAHKERWLNAQSRGYLIIPVSISYEFLDEDSAQHTTKCDSVGYKWKPNVRISCGMPQSFKDFVGFANGEANALNNLKSHIRHDITKNTPIMSVQILSMFLQYQKKSLNVSLGECEKLIREFQNEFHSKYDLGFVGDINVIARYSMAVISSRGICSSAAAVNIIKIESLMMKSLLLVTDMTEIDSHLETYHISENKLREKFRKMVELLRYEVDYLHPPCLSASEIENKALDVLQNYCVCSHVSDEPNCNENQMARKLAKYLDVDFEEEEDSIDELPTKEILLYVNRENLLSRKWVANIVTSLLDIYYTVARQVLELRTIDLVEESVFIRDVKAALQERNLFQIPVSELNATIKNALKLFMEHGILESYTHSSVTVLYLKDFCNHDNLLKLVYDFAQLC